MKENKKAGLRLIVTLMAVAIIANAAPLLAQSNVLTNKEKKQGWRLLFDGTTTTEWMATKGGVFPEKGWVVDGGVLTVLGNDGADHARGGDIITREQFANFELALEFKIPKGANSGVKYLVVNDFPEQKGSYLGMEYQIIDNVNHPDGKQGRDGNRTAGSLYDLITAKDPPAVEVDQWTQVRILVNGNHVEHWLNGKKVVEFERNSDEFAKLVAASKYKSLANFGRAQKGHILLQGHGDTVHFRNIKIRTL